MAVIVRRRLASSTTWFSKVQLGYEACCEDIDVAGGHISLLDWPIACVNNSTQLLLPLYFIVSLGCYGLLMVGVGLMQFPTCPKEAALLQLDIGEAKNFLKQRGFDVGSI